MSQAKDVVLAYVDALNRGDVEGMCKLFTSDAVIHGLMGPGTVESFRPIWKNVIESLEEHLQVDAIIAEANIVVVRFTERGKSVREFKGQGPTGKSYEITAIEWFEIKGNLIHRRWGARDTASQFRQLGFKQ